MLAHLAGQPFSVRYEEPEGELSMRDVDGIEAFMPIRLTQVDTLGYDPAHVRLPSDSVSTSSFSDLTCDSEQWWVSTVCLRILWDQMSLC